MTLSELDKRIVCIIQGDMPISSRPYQIMAQQIGISEEIFIERLQTLCDHGVIRRLGATLRHQKSGFRANAMVAWKVNEKMIHAVGQQMAKSPQITHCYRRNPSRDWPYNLYTMIHAHHEEDCKTMAKALSEKTQVKEYQILFSVKELKKTSMKYFECSS